METDCLYNLLWFSTKCELHSIERFVEFALLFVQSVECSTFSWMCNIGLSMRRVAQALTYQILRNLFK